MKSARSPAQVRKGEWALWTRIVVGWGEGAPQQESVLTSDEGQLG